MDDQIGLATRRLKTVGCCEGEITVLGTVGQYRSDAALAVRAGSTALYSAEARAEAGARAADPKSRALETDASG